MLPFPPGKCGESVVVIAAQLDPNEEARRVKTGFFFLGTRCYYACVCCYACRLVAGLWTASPFPSSRTQSVLSLCVCNVGYSTSRNLSVTSHWTGWLLTHLSVAFGFVSLSPLAPCRGLGNDGNVLIPRRDRPNPG